jgi:HEAT repeat protein
MIDLSSLTADDVFKIMLDGQEEERDIVQEGIIKGSLKVDRPRLRQLVIDALKSRFRPGSELDADMEERSGYYVENEVARTRTWLVSILTTVADDDQVIQNYLVSYLDPGVEGNPWIPYWMLFGLIRKKDQQLPVIADKACSHPEPLVNMVGSCLKLRLALDGGQGQSQEAQALRQTISDSMVSDDSKLAWATLRALRLVPLHNDIASIRQKICAIVEHGDARNITFDAVVALGFIDANTPAAEAVSKTLTRFIEDSRRNPIKDGLRVKAINSLGKLNDRDSSHILLEELVADNPAVVREAARALEASVGIRAAVQSVIEEAAQKPSNGQPLTRSYANALRWLSRQNEVADVLEEQMQTGSEDEKDVARQLLTDIGGQRAVQKLAILQKSLKEFTELLTKTQEGVQRTFDQSVAEARTGYRILRYLDVTVFIIGTILVASTALMLLMREGSLTNWFVPVVTGGTGVGAMLYTLFLSNPRQRIQDAINNLMQLHMIYMGHIRQLNQVDQAYTRELLSEDSITIDELEKYTKLIEERTQQAFTSLRKIGTPREADKDT